MNSENNEKISGTLGNDEVTLNFRKCFCYVRAGFCSNLQCNKISWYRKFLCKHSILIKRVILKNKNKVNYNK